MEGHQSVVEADDLVVTKGSLNVLDGVSLTVDHGDRILIQGPSGAGKTTLFKVFALLEPSTSGTLFIGGNDVRDLSERERARLRRDIIGIIFQDFQLVPDLTAWENVALPQEHAGERDEDWLTYLFDHLHIDGLEDAYPASLSGGERQRVAIARALANRPAVILADEPTGQLDPATADRVLDLLFDLQSETDTALVTVSHDTAITEYFPKTYRLKEGELTSVRDASTVSSDSY